MRPERTGRVARVGLGRDEIGLGLGIKVDVKKKMSFRDFEAGNKATKIRKKRFFFFKKSNLVSSEVK